MQDMITLVDEDDNVIGPISKLDAHFKMPANNKTIDSNNIENNTPHLHQSKSYLHRAFSLLLFNSKNELLLQQRSKKKITFPNLWTNTCCSHNGHIQTELEVEPDYIGMRRAAVRRSQFELGITELDANTDLKVGSRILYYADNCPQFAEHELDYIVFAKKDLKTWDPKRDVNKDEIESVEWVSLKDFDEFLEYKRTKDGSDITPWFKLLKESKLTKWWQDLIDHDKFPNEASKIERFV